MEAIKGIFHGATPEELRERFAKHVAQAKDTLRVLTTPEGGAAEGDAPAGYADATTPMNVVELFNCQALVFVSAWKAGAVVSAMHGHGFVIKRVRGEGRGYGGPTMARWSAPLPIELTSGAIGLTLGVGSMDSVLVLDTEKAVDAFKHTQVSLGNDFTVRVGKEKRVPLGGDGGGHIDLAKFRDMGTTWDSFSYTIAKGALVDMSFSGDGVSVSHKLVDALYGTSEEGPLVDDKGHMKPESILQGEVPPPESMTELYDALELTMSKYWESYKAKKARDAGISSGGGTAAAQGGPQEPPAADAAEADEATAAAAAPAAAAASGDVPLEAVPRDADAPAPAAEPESEAAAPAEASGSADAPQAPAAPSASDAAPAEWAKF